MLLAFGDIKCKTYDGISDSAVYSRPKFKNLFFDQKFSSNVRIYLNLKTFFSLQQTYKDLNNS
jgi:hypothetical protein